MANDLYDIARDKYGSAALSWPSDNYRCVAVDGSYIPDLAGHDSLADIPPTSRIVVSQPVTNKRITRGYFQADPTPFPLFNDSREVAGIALYKDGVSESASWLVAWIDEGGGLPFTPAAREYYILWQVGTQGVLRL